LCDWPAIGQAEAFALHFVTKEVGEHYQVILEQLRNNDLSSLADFHSTTSGLKVSPHLDAAQARARRSPKTNVIAPR
jgi:hypothetical protein